MVHPFGGSPTDGRFLPGHRPCRRLCGEVTRYDSGGLKSAELDDECGEGRRDARKGCGKGYLEPAGGFERIRLIDRRDLSWGQDLTSEALVESGETAYSNWHVCFGGELSFA